MISTLIVGAAPAEGAEDFYRRLLSDAALVVAADAAGEWCVELGRVPDLVVGDFDSARPGAQARLSALDIEVVGYSADKDETDLELAVAVARERAAGPITITAAFTRRLDHTLAALGALTSSGPGATAIEPGWSARVCTASAPVRYEAAVGETVSVLAVGRASGVEVRGTKWTLSGALLTPLSGHGVSNTALGGTVSVACSSGTLIVMAVRDDTTGEIY
jgi:thiamine pyrophosphokinase